MPKSYDVGEIISTLYRLAGEFNTKAIDGGRAAKALQEAAEALREERAKNRDLQRELTALQQQKPAEKKPAGETVTILIDGSGSMTSRDNPPVITALEATLSLAKSGVNVWAAFWGDDVIRPIPLDGSSAAPLAALAGKTGSEFGAALDLMRTAAATSPQHFIIISDGDFDGVGGALMKTLALLGQNPKATLDFVVIAHKGSVSEMERFAQTLRKELPAQVGLHTPGDENLTLTLALVKIAARRTGKPVILPTGPKPPF